MSARVTAPPENARTSHEKSHYTDPRLTGILALDLRPTARCHGPAIAIDEATGCWLWLRGGNDTGYGILAIRRRSHYAHRVYYERHRGPIPAWHHLDHLCRNRRCVNPAHLEPVTCAENIRRGRIAKLTAAQVREIARRLDAGETQSALAREYGVSHQTINCLDRGITWSELTGRAKAPRRGKAP